MNEHSENSLDVIALDSNFNRRLLQDREKLQEIRKSKEKDYVIVEGDYSNMFFLNQEIKYLENKSLDLSGEEVVLYDIIQQKLLNKEENEQQKNSPIIIADIGGMYASSWCRLSLHFEEEIKKGNIIFVVTNLTTDGNDLFDRFRQDFKERGFDERTMNAFLMGKGLVEWRKMSTSEFWEEYKGKIDLVHEHRALTHSILPDLDIPLIADTLKADGIFINSSTGKTNSTNHEIGDEYQHVFERAMQTMKEKYVRILEGKTKKAIWAKNANVSSYFKNPREYPAVIKYKKKLKDIGRLILANLVSLSSRL